MAGAPSDFGKLITAETEKWAKVIWLRQRPLGWLAKQQ
jgi:hypothetical protein